MKNFADRLLEAIDEKQNPCCIGLDPRIKNIPQYIRDENIDKYGNTMEAVGRSFLDFNMGIIDATHDVVPAYKPQMAFYEQYGEFGVAAFKRTVEHVKRNGCIAIEDAKRNDIGSTSKAYADGHLGEVELCDATTKPSLDVDAITVNPYLGSDCTNPFVENCKKHGKGIFVLVKTSNKSSGEIQDKQTDIFGDAEKLGYVPQVFTDVAQLVDEWGRDVIGERGYSSVGAVVGATYPIQAITTRKLMSKAIILVPGVGAQGATGKDTIPNFNKDGQGAIINSSRGIIFAYQTEQFKRNEFEFDKAARESALAMKDDITSALKEAGILRW